MAEWQDALLIALSSQRVFEMAGPLPSGNVGRGYFNFDSADRRYCRHLKMDRLAAICLLSVAGERGETHQVAFYDRGGQRVFSVYVPRDDEGALNAQVYSQFVDMKRDYAALGKSTSQTDTSCSMSVSVGAQ